MQNKLSKKERLEALISHYTGGKRGAFADKIGVAASTISTWLKRDSMDYELLFAKCEGLSATWLLTGEGEMIQPAMDDAPPAGNAAEKESHPSEISMLLQQVSTQQKTIDKLAEALNALVTQGK